MVNALDSDSLEDGSDVSVWHFQAATEAWTRIGMVLRFGSEWDAATTVVHVKLLSAVPVGTSNQEYWLYAGGSAAGAGPFVSSFRTQFLRTDSDLPVTSSAMTALNVAPGPAHQIDNADPAATYGVFAQWQQGSNNTALPPPPPGSGPQVIPFVDNMAVSGLVPVASEQPNGTFRGSGAFFTVTEKRNFTLGIGAADPDYAFGSSCADDVGASCEFVRNPRFLVFLLPGVELTDWHLLEKDSGQTVATGDELLLETTGSENIALAQDRLLIASSTFGNSMTDHEVASVSLTHGQRVGRISQTRGDFNSFSNPPANDHAAAPFLHVGRVDPTNEQVQMTLTSLDAAQNSGARMLLLGSHVFSFVRWEQDLISAPALITANNSQSFPEMVFPPPNTSPFEHDWATIDVASLNHDKDGFGTASWIHDDDTFNVQGDVVFVEEDAYTPFPFIAAGRGTAAGSVQIVVTNTAGMGNVGVDDVSLLYLRYLEANVTVGSREMRTDP